MNKMNKMKKTVAMLLGVTMAIGATGCQFVVTDNEKDMKQTVATVDISESLTGEMASASTELNALVGNLSTDISKRELVTYFLSNGYQYVENYGYSYADTFNMMLDGLVNREIILQYALAYYLTKGKADGISAENCKKYIEAELASDKITDKEKELLKEYPEVLTFKYFLTDGGKTEKTDDYNPLEDYERAVYQLKKSVNDSLDSMEKNYINAESEEHDHAEARTLPTGVNTAKEDYYTTNYEIYTGRNTLDKCGEYEKVEGSTRVTRQKAYNSFLANLQSYALVQSSGKVEDTADLTHLSYYYVEMSSVLGQALINKYFDDLTAEITAKIDEQDGKYVSDKYASLVADQTQAYATSPTDFNTAIGSVGADSYLLYGMKNFGFVYNILLPFSTSQEVKYNTAKNNTENSQDELYNIRKQILSEVKGKDLRDSWISDHEHANYSNVLDADYKAGDPVYFFENQLTESTQYEMLTQYAGNYAFNGTVDTTGEEISVKSNSVSIDEFITIFESQLNKNVGAGKAVGAKETAYETTEYTAEDGKVDYGKFTYYKGKVALEATAKDYFNPESDLYKAVATVNELMFAYSTDTGCLNTYMGYSVSPYGTNFVKEFEYAAQQVVKDGVGSYAVCATDYGWHIVFASFVYGEGDVYGGYNHAEKDTKGTFSNLFYNSLKASASSNYSTEVQNNVLTQYNNDSCVTRFQDAYQDLLDIQ